MITRILHMQLEGAMLKSPKKRYTSFAGLWVSDSCLTGLTAFQEFGAEFAFFCWLSRKNVLRKWCIRVASHKYFEIVIVIAIIANSIILGLSDFTVVDSDLNPASSGLKYENGVMVSAHSYRNRLLELSEIPFTIIFTTECVIKVVAMGFISGKGSYLRDSWNLLDFIVVLSRYECMLLAS